MNKNLSYTFVGLTLVAALWASCSDKKPKSGRTDTYSSGVISFASDESFSPIIEEEREVFEFTYKKAKVNPIYTNESDGMQMLLDKKTCLLITARDYKPEELQSLKDRGNNPRTIIIAYDGLALISHKTNTDSCISVKDFVRILNGEATKWSDIYPGSKRGDIALVFDNQKSSAVHYVQDSLLGGKPIANPNVTAALTSAEVVNYVAKTPNAIGIIGSNWLNDKRDTTNLTFNKDIQVMSVSKLEKATPRNSWKPYQYYIYNDNYPLIRTIYALINDPRNGLPWGFAHFLESPVGQKIILKSGLLPYRGDIILRSVNVKKE
ncbi:MAG: substrate-binding domain-containing protein [Prevotella sp.]|nr:substrate-binding domain-containing protein [Prevotella sp.]MBR5036850.1 substrate-binding domain-containing protein [Prevotella sp.]MBR5697886.1 substrate-binding domain-containing protein [Prevotella sp.]